MQLNLKELELSQETDRQLKTRLENIAEKLVSENADLSSSLSETRQKLESEVRVRENRDARLLLDTQELAVARERERELKQDIIRIQTDLERERTRMRNLSDKVIIDKDLAESVFGPRVFLLIANCLNSLED